MNAARTEAGVSMRLLRAVLLKLVAGVFLVDAHAADAQSPPAPATRTRVVLLGTGTPPADPDRSGPATAIVVNDMPYLVDFGAGVVRRAKAAVADRGIAALEPANLRVVFLTHLHSDHTVGYPDLILTPWVLGRKVPLEVYGPPGIREMTAHIQAAYGADYETRSRHFEEKLYAVGSFPKGHDVNAHEVRPGVVYQDANITVTAFATRHAMPSYGYRFDTADRSIVISGDTNPTQAVVDACSGCDVLIHEVLTEDWLAKRPDFRRYADQFHTTSTQLAELATRAKPRLLIMHHASIAWRPAVDSERSRPEDLLQEVMRHYAGHVVVGRDLAATARAIPRFIRHARPQAADQAHRSRPLRPSRPRLQACPYDMGATTQARVRHLYRALSWLRRAGQGPSPASKRPRSSNVSRASQASDTRGSALLCPVRRARIAAAALTVLTFAPASV